MVFKFTIDKVLDKYVPPSFVPSLPQPFKRLFGGTKQTPKSDYWIWLDILIGSFCGIALIEGTFKSPNIFSDNHNAPLIIASYSATAILCFNAISVPLAQPRNIFFGHFFSSLIGVCISKLFSLSTHGQNNYWAAGALSVGISSVLMSILNCVHPPAGASALLPCVDEGIRKMSWWYLPTHLVSSVLIICVSLITNNVLREYPAYWWTSSSKPKQTSAVANTDQTDKQIKIKDSESVSSEKKKDYSFADIFLEVKRLNDEGKRETFRIVNFQNSLEISHRNILIPEGCQLTVQDLKVLELIYYRAFHDNSLDAVL